MAEVIFLFCVHNHQPVGNFHSVLEKAFADCYLPFLKNLVLYPEIKFALHFSGPLWEYMETEQPEAMNLIRLMVERNQLELLGGAFYEPILAIIPEWDRQGQLLLMADYLESRFGVRPQGAWLAERIWEPQLAKTLAEAGYKYTLLDEEHFHYAGLNQPRRPFLTEDQGCPLVIFPIDKKLRYLIPFRSIQEIDFYFQEIAHSGGLAILGDDGEKFGLWPGTKAWVYESGWLGNFLNYLRTSQIKMMTFSEFLSTRPRLNLAYLPPASYEEMMEWILPLNQLKKLRELKLSLSPEFRRLLRGGYFREFFLKYPESNHLHKRMLFLSKWIKEQAIEEPEIVKNLYRSQCNDAYWHGIFGGLYLPHLRQAVYFHLLEAEKKAGLKSGWELVDYDFDGRPEIFLRHKHLSLLFKPGAGGSLVELAYYPLSRNLSNVLSRWPEAYHHYSSEASEGKSIHELARKLPENYEFYLRYDDYPRFCLLDHFFAPETTFEDWKQRKAGEAGDFIQAEYDFELPDGGLHLRRKGKVHLRGKDYQIKIDKFIRPEDQRLLIEYEITNEDEAGLDCLFAQEWNLYLLPEEWSLRQNRIFLLKERLDLAFQPEPQFWTLPLETLSQSEEGFEIIFQGVNWLALWPLQLKPGEKFIFSVFLNFNNEP
jgi:hypothetical protein